jgi:D-cysteine desulfhydrase
MYTRSPYAAPSWTNGALATAAVPSERIHLGRFPTPMHRWSPPGYEGFSVWLKRDDLSSFDLSGNKVRKLEFLMAKAVQEGYDSVVTIGGIQSNHARATACCARQLGLEPHLILRTPQPDNDPGVIGNLLLDRLVGAKLHLVSTSNYARIGGESLLAQLERDLLAAGRRPFIIPVGGSDPLGAWGYLEAVEEMLDQQRSLGMEQFDHIVFACGSGGTATGLALGSRLAGLSSKIQAVGVCDSPGTNYFHPKIYHKISCVQI